MSILTYLQIEELATYRHDATARSSAEELLGIPVRRKCTMASSPQPLRARRPPREDPRFRELVESAPDAIIEFDGNGRIVLLNGMTEELFGYTRDELLGQPVEILIPEELRVAHMLSRKQYYARPVTRPMGKGLALLGRHKDGSRIPVEISLSPVKALDGFSVIAIIRDIRERRKAEDKLRAIQEKFTSELKLRNKEIEQADLLKSEFLSSMSHELRTPLHTIIGFSELLAEELKGPLNEDQQRFVQHIHKDSMHLLELINEILDLDKIEAGRLELRMEIFDVSVAIEAALSSVRPRGEAKAIRIETRVAASMMLYADCLRFKQILINLLTNAVKFTPEAGGILIVATPRTGFAEIAVSDTGIGVTEDNHDLIFDKFYQASESTRGVGEGTGLGLAITKALVEQHGGRIWLESTPGKGSCFTFTIPAQPAPPQEDTP